MRAVLPPLVGVACGHEKRFNYGTSWELATIVCDAAFIFADRTHTPFVVIAVALDADGDHRCGSGQ